MNSRNNRSDFYLKTDSKRSWTIDLGEIYDYLELLYFFAWRNIKVKYKQAFVGIGWVLFQPIVMVSIFTFFVKKVLEVESSTIPYPIFAYSGFLLWTAFSASLSNASGSMVANFHIIQKVYFPRIIIPMSSVIVSVLDFCIGFVLLIFLIVFMQHPVNILQALFCWPAGLLLALLGAAGPGFLLAAINVKYRDIQYIIPFCLQMLLFVTPVIYPISMVKSVWIQHILALNPMYASISIFRLPMDSMPLDSVFILMSISSTVALLFLGAIYFKYSESYFADLL